MPEEIAKMTEQNFKQCLPTLLKRFDPAVSELLTQFLEEL